MRIEPYTTGDIIHAYNRGNRKMPIVHDENDRWRFLKILRYFNDEYSPPRIFSEIADLQRSNLCKPFEWPISWPEHRPLVKIIAYHLTNNHFHLLLKEINNGGISLFMKKIGDGFTGYINAKYKETGKLFQGSYKGRTPKDEKGLQYLDAYVQVFNPFEIYPGGIEKSLKEFNKAFEFAIKYPFCSLGESFGKRNLGIIDRDVLKEIFPSLEIYKDFAYDALMVRNIREILGKEIIE
ncbi:MAG: transposase [Patescibacteria group bacterium]|nr:transposase [Patescibacteria group bacterium]